MVLKSRLGIAPTQKSTHLFKNVLNFFVCIKLKFVSSINNTNRRKSEFLNKKVVVCDLK